MLVLVPRTVPVASRETRRVEYWPRGHRGVGGRRTRVNGVWQPEQQFVIDGMTEPDAVSLVDGEDGYWSGSNVGWSGSNAVHGDYHALQWLTGLTFNYVKRLQGAYFQSTVDFRALPNPIAGPETTNYNLHGLVRQVCAKQAYALGVVWTSGAASDLWFIKRRVEGY